MKRRLFVLECVVYLAVTLMTVLTLDSCETWNPVEQRRRTILVYMSGDNDLWPDMNMNLNAMAKGMDAQLSAYNSLVVFVDKPKGNSVLLNIRNNKCDTVKVWSENLSSSSPEVLSMVIGYVTDAYPAMSYGLVVSSHGTGWIPASALRRIDPGMYGLPLGALRPAPITKAVCCEMTLAGKMRWMEVRDMAEAIPSGQFDFILFDACLMAGAETVCELGGKTRYVIGSSVEVMSSGFPYSLIMQDMFDGNYAGVCRKTYEYYDTKKGDERTCGVALIDVNKIGALGEAFRKVVENATVDVDDIDLFHGVQRCDRYRNPVMFDLLDVAERLKPDSAALDGLNRALSECVTACYHTDWVIQQLKLDRYCGLSCYLPASKYDYINPSFFETEWNTITGFLKK